MWCGGDLSASSSAADDTPLNNLAPRASAACRPGHLAQRILQSRSALEGERKQVTELFADVNGAMERAEQLDPEEWHRILARFFAILTDGVHRFEGTVNQYIGDGIMALFGAPIAHEDHAQRARYAALHIREALRAQDVAEVRLHGAAGYACAHGDLRIGQAIGHPCNRVLFGAPVACRAAARPVTRAGVPRPRRRPRLPDPSHAKRQPFVCKTGSSRAARSAQPFVCAC